MPGPISDVLTTGWTVAPGGAAYAALDEAVLDTADYVSCPVGTPQPIILGINELPAGTHLIPTVAADDSASQYLVVSLLDGSSNVLGYSTPQALTATPTEYNISVTVGSAATRIQYEFVGPDWIDLNGGILALDGGALSFILGLPAGFMGLDGGVLGLDGGILGLA